MDEYRELFMWVVGSAGSLLVMALFWWLVMQVWRVVPNSKPRYTPAPKPGCTDHMIHTLQQDEQFRQDTPLRERISAS